MPPCPPVARSRLLTHCPQCNECTSQRRGVTICQNARSHPFTCSSSTSRLQQPGLDVTRSNPMAATAADGGSGGLSSSSTSTPEYAAGPTSSSRASIHSVRSGGRKKQNKSESPTFTKFLSNLLRKALGGGSGSGSGIANGPKSPTDKRQSDPAATSTTAPPAYQHPQRTSSSNAHHFARQPSPPSTPSESLQPALATASLVHLPTSLPALFASAAQAFDTAATRLIACDEPLATTHDDDTVSATSTESTRLWHTLALHLRSTFPAHLRHLLQPVLTPVDLVPYLASLLAELALDVCQTLVPGSPLAEDQIHALHVYTNLDSDAHVQETIQGIVKDLLLTLAAIHPACLPVDQDDRAALDFACREAARAVVGMRAVHPMLSLDSPAAHAPLDADLPVVNVQWIGMDVGRDVRPGGRKVVSDANLVAYVVFPGVHVPNGVDVGDAHDAMPRPVVGAYHDPQAYLAGRKRDLYAAAMAAKAAAATAKLDKDAHVSELEAAMMAHWHHLQVECEDQNELERQRRRADEELILANAYGAQMTLFMADGIVDG
ncbi:hypothetical protein BCR44DRAFT_1260856 [Catenaria anguillulae PL171]|uniref:Uncharacterized protein n=1 Tax=Catenaria anguillulae PL171 TaxID=765915 RepID=A0A1Y2HFE3_9FUNG|nr:hypothetical protein BCR44DRAFT_1260856 [Catenaria anguillulae PL171]